MIRGLGFLGLLVTIAIVAVVGVIAYQAGWSEGFAQHAPQAGSTAAPAGYYPYYYGGPHLFGFRWIFGLLFFFFIVWLFAPLAVGFGPGGHPGRGHGRRRPPHPRPPVRRGADRPQRGVGQARRPRARRGRLSDEALQP